MNKIKAIVLILGLLLWRGQGLKLHDSVMNLERDLLEFNDEDFSLDETSLEDETEGYSFEEQEQSYLITKRIKCICKCGDDKECRIKCIKEIPDPVIEDWIDRCMDECTLHEQRCVIRCYSPYNLRFCPSAPPKPVDPEPSPKPSIHCIQGPNTWAHDKCLTSCSKTDGKCCERCNIYYRIRPGICTNNECSRKKCQQPCRNAICAKQCHDRYPPLNEIKV